MQQATPAQGEVRASEGAGPHRCLVNNNRCSFRKRAISDGVQFDLSRVVAAPNLGDVR